MVVALESLAIFLGSGNHYINAYCGVDRVVYPHTVKQLLET